jgi:hypothetical protein
MGVSDSRDAVSRRLHANCRRPAALVAVGLLLVLPSACRDVDVVTGSYSTLAEARQAGAIDRGWIPRGVPAGAHDIREAHDLDTNRHWGLFNFPAAEAAALRALLEPDEMPLTGVECDIPARIEWWPLLLRGSLNPEQIKNAGLKAYRVRQEALIVVVNWNQGRAYYWRH